MTESSREEMERKAKAYNRKKQGDFPEGAIYVRLSREGAGAIVEASFIEGWQARDEEVANLKARIEAYEKEDEHEAMDCYVKHKEMDKLRAEVQRLREALKRVQVFAEENTEVTEELPRVQSGLKWLLNIARQALSEAK